MPRGAQRRKRKQATCVALTQAYLEPESQVGRAAFAARRTSRMTRWAERWVATETPPKVTPPGKGDGNGIVLLAVAPPSVAGYFCPPFLSERVSGAFYCRRGWVGSGVDVNPVPATDRAWLAGSRAESRRFLSRSGLWGEGGAGARCGSGSTRKLRDLLGPKKWEAVRNWVGIRVSRTLLATSCGYFFGSKAR